MEETDGNTGPTSKETSELIALLDKYLLLRGEIFTFPDPDSSSASAAIASDSKLTVREALPPSLQIYPDVGLDSHLQDLERERAELDRLTARVAAVCLDRRVVSMAKARLAEDFAALHNDHVDGPVFPKKALPEMLAHVRAAQQQAKTGANTFALITANGVRFDGTPERMEIYRLPKDASWYEAQQSLTDMTVGWQAREAGYPYGYGLKDGKWMYQVAKGSSLESGKYDLATTEQYRTMRGKIEQDGVKVTVWHELVLKAAREAEEKYNAGRDVRCENPEDEPLDEHGKPIFAPTFDIADLASPEYEPLSDHE